MTNEALLHLTATVEQAACVAVPLLLVALWMATRKLPRVEPARDRPGEPVTAREIALLLLVVSGALVLRYLWWDHGLPGTIFGGELITARADLALQRGGLWTRWWELVRSPNTGGWLYDSPIIEPVVVAFQLLFEPRTHGIVRVGAAFGVAAVVFAWLTGRYLHGPRFALLFAAFVAVSPLQVVWSRLGYRAMAAPPHLLLALAVAALAARRGSHLLAALTGVVSYATVYNHELARVAIPLTVFAVWSATRAPVRRNLRFLSLSLVIAGVVVTLAATVSRVGVTGMLWPTYPGYAGNQGERTLGELIERNYQGAKTEGRQSLEAYFLVNRNSPPRPSSWSWGIASGGLTFLPIILLGAIGALYALTAPSRHLLWYATLLLGLALPALGRAEARRLLAFDLGWCAFAALGLTTLARTPLLARVPRRQQTLLAGTLLVAIGAWTLAAIVLLRDGPSYRGRYSVPFGTGYLHDIITCRRCIDAGAQWEADIRDGKLVVLVDSDLDRETPTGPAGLPLYGYLAAAASGARDRFQELYPILWNFNGTPEIRRYYTTPGEHAAFLRELLGRTPYRSIVWHVERPTAWDRWFADRLATIGATRSTFTTPLGDGPGLRLETTKAQEDAVLAILESLGTASTNGPPCVSATSVRRETFTFQPNSLAIAHEPSNTSLPVWFALGWNEASVPDGVWPLPAVRHVAARFRDGSGEVVALRRDGYVQTYAWPSRGLTATRPLIELMPIGRACAAFAGDDWWVVDPERGVLKSPTPHDWIPPGAWMGLASDGADELVLAAADQRVVVLDLANHVVKFEFPATVTPSRTEEFGECAQLARGRGWIGVHQASSNRVAIYADPGRGLGTLDLERLGIPWVRAVGGAGTFLAAGQGGLALTTLKLDLSACGPAAAGP